MSYIHVIYLHLFLIIGLLLPAALFSYLVKRNRLGQLQRVFRRFNDSDPPDLQILVAWIKEKRGEGRLIEVIDYLRTIERDDLAVALYQAFPFDTFHHRHVRLFAARAYLDQREAAPCLKLCERLRAAFPKDDSVLELQIEAFLTFGPRESARELLLPRLRKKYEGTVFARQRACLHAADGELEEAVIILRKVVSKDNTLFQNTFAQPNKRFIAAQLEKSRALLAQFEAEIAQAAEAAS
ncbi:hypothetical protein [Acanthopleuribacter pedis]|uniref:Uncharacterized protein n=1 Tax=Acanthopleuribacter pedis TaxID=442870 RepID=A0A8J7QPZ0_9BACT|nr:hypothetical protein [Acanthopleuribacter pedis]MBO1322000.1 hypothetical protein [Acanthopleuribacter pedis]